MSRWSTSGKLHGEEPPHHTHSLSTYDNNRRSAEWVLSRITKLHFHSLIRDTVHRKSLRLTRVLEHEHGEKLRVRSALRWQILRPIFFFPIQPIRRYQEDIYLGSLRFQVFGDKVSFSPRTRAVSLLRQGEFLRVEWVVRFPYHRTHHV